ncbi:MAG: hypothetical protein BTM30_09360 [Synechococcus lacustris str. Tous]|nr:MAG: hypothetical protein BTM30_09360 [Synechococcus lacustris str. Tous]
MRSSTPFKWENLPGYDSPEGQTRIFINDNEQPALPTYTLTPSASSINEGSTLTTSVATTDVASGTTLYYSLSGSGINSSDFSSGSLTGSGSVGSDGSFSFSHTLANDLTTEGKETLSIKLFSDSSRSTQVGSTASVSIADTSITPTPTYTLTPSTSSINEGSTLTTSIATTNVASGTTLYYSLSGTGINSSDFSSGALTGSGSVGSDGSFSFSHTLANDLTTEGAETLNIKLFSDSSRSTQVGSTASVAIADTSIPPAVFSVAGTIVTEGSAANILITRSGNTSIPVDLNVFTSNNNATAGLDYTSISSVLSFNSGETLKSVSINTIDDSSVESSETFNVFISSTNANASISTQSAGVTILDNDFNPIYSITPSSTSTTEGASLTTTINTTYVPNGTTLYWSLSGNGITASDFSSGSLSDGANTGSDGKITFSHTFANDLTTEGAEILNIILYKDSNRSQQIASTAIFISDTSIAPASGINITGGNNGIANTGTINNNGSINTGTVNTNSGNTTNTNNVTNVTNNYVYHNSNNTTTNTNSGNTLNTWNTFWVDNSIKAGDIVNQWFGTAIPTALQTQDPTDTKLLDITTSSWTEKVKINRVAKASDKGDTIEGKQKETGSTDIVGSVLTGGKGNDRIQAMAGWDMVDGGDGDDLVKTGNGRDILTGGTGRDELWGGFGWNTYKGDKDGFSDLIVIKSDQHLANPTLGNKAGNNGDGSKTDIIENLDSIDKLIIQGVETNQITFANATAQGLTGIGIYSKGFIEALYTGGDLSVAQLTATTTGDTSAAVMNNTLTSYGVW